MILTRLVLENYGAYKGRNVLELETTQDRPIVLIGGVNGAGKTTILDSILLGLYGRSIFGRGVSARKYRDYLSKLVHRKNRHRARFAAVEVEFRIHHSGAEDTYLVRREWESVGEELDTLSVSRNGEALDEPGRETWQQFMDSLVPPGIARIFFFDGEKIAKIAEDVGHGAGGGDKGVFRASMDTMLGIDLIRQLRADLNLFITRSGGKESSETVSEYERVLAEKRDMEGKMELVRAELDSKSAALDEVAKRAASLEARIQNLGGEYANRRGELIEQRADSAAAMRMLESSLKETLSGSMVLGVVSDRLKRVAEQVSSDERSARLRVGSEAMAQKAHELEAAMAGGAFWDGVGISEADRGAVSSKILSELSSGGEGDVAAEPAFDMSQADSAYILELARAVPAGVEAMASQAAAYTAASKRLADAEERISMAPREDEMVPLASEIKGLHKETGALATERAHLEETLARHDAGLRTIKKRLGAIVDAIKKTDRGIMGVKLATDAIDTLEEYEAKIKRKKMSGMEERILESIRHLMHKEDFVTRVSVDPDDYGIVLYGKDDVAIPLESPSKGEMQMIATAILWSMVKVSEKPLPFVIDTPLARLDAEHRDNLLRRFYPVASHQVIILSTDTEIRAAEYGALKDHISRAYTIAYDEAEGRTLIREGYLADREGIAIEA